jgi:acetyl esterase/lipase
MMRVQTVQRDLAYVPDGHVRQKLDLHLPRTGEKAPLIVYIHGGAYLGGDKNSPFMPKRLLEKGYAIASLNYRLSPDAIYPAQIEDCKAAVRWLRAHSAQHQIDPARFVAWGESAGGHLAALLGAMGADHDSAVQGVVDYYGPSDFLQMDAHAIPGTQQHDQPGSPASRVIGGAIQQNKEKVARANPVTFLTSKAPPFFLAHGTRDRVVPYHQSVLLAEALAERGVRFVFHPVQDTDHGFGGITAEQGKALDRATDAFLAGLF